MGFERLVTVVGPGGCGKTRLALEVLHAVPGDLIGFVELAGADQHALLPTVLAACGVWEDPGSEPLDRLHGWLRERAGLLVLDNCEHLHEDVAAFVSALLRHCPAVHVLVTSRVTLGLAAEVVVPLVGLDPAGDGSALFLERAQGVQPGLVKDARTRESALAICLLADGLPLAIELAAAHTRGLSLDEVRAGMADQLRFLDQGEVGALPQHRSLQASISWSVHLINTQARRVLRALSVFDGRFTLGAARAVADEDGGATAALETLVDHSLVQFDPQDERYVLLDTIRAYALRELVACGELEPVQARLLDWAHGLATAVRGGLGRAEPAALRQVDRDDAGLRAALEHALRTGHRPDLLGEIVVGLTFAWSLRGRCAQGRALAERVRAAQDAPSCLLTWATGFLALYSGDVEAGAQLAASAAEQAAQAGDGGTEGRALILVGMASLFVDPVAAEPVLARAAELADLAGDDWGHVEALQVLAYSHLYRSDHRAAVECADRARPALDRLGHGQLQAWDNAVRADAAAQSGRFADAERAGLAGLALALSVEEPVSAGGALLPLVRALVHLDRAAEAVALVEAARPFLRVHTGLGTSLLLDLAAAVAACWSDPAAAHDLLAQAQHAGVAGGVAVAAAEAGVLLSASRSTRGDVDGALAAAAGATGWAAAVGSRELPAAADLAACTAHRTAGRGLDRSYAALGELARLGLLPQAADGLDVVAGLVLDRGRTAVAARLHAASTRGDLQR